MSIEGCDLYTDEQYDSVLQDFSSQCSWNGHMIIKEDNSIIFSGQLFKDHSIQMSWGQRQILPMGGKAGASVEAKTDSDGNTSASGEVHVSASDDDGSSVSVGAEASVSSDSGGNISTEGKIEVSVEYEF